MENDNKWNHHQDDGPIDYTQHPTGATFTPANKMTNDKYIASKPEKLETLENDFENDYPNYERKSQQDYSKIRNDYSNENLVIGSENTFDTFNSSNPDNVDSGIRLDDERKSTFNDAIENDFIAKDSLNDDWESNEFDSNTEEEDDNYPKHPEF